MKLRFLAVAAAAALALTGCSTGTVQQQPGSASATQGGGAAAETVPAALRFSAPTLDGELFDGAQLAGQPAVLWFWAPWCVICQREAPGVATAAAEFGDTVAFLGVAAQDGPEAMRGFVDRFGLQSMTTLNDEEAEVWASFGVTQQPAFAFISADGDLEVVKGALSEQELGERLTALSGA